jgi:hypothetical protein
MTWDMLLAPCWTFYQYLITNEIYSSDANRAAHVDLVVDEELGDYKGLTEGVPTPDTITVAMLDAWYATYNV